MLKQNTLILSISLFLTSCMTYDPYTDEQKVSDSTKGAIIGGVAGAVLGNQVRGDRHTRDNAMIVGGLLGAAAGGAIGNNMDKKEAALRHKLQSTGVRVRKSGNQIILNMPGNITFDKNSSAIKPEFEEVLDSVAAVLMEFKDSNVEVSGHADSSGSIEANQVLSTQRANSVASYLRSKGVSASRIVATGYGKSNPVGNESSANRRVEIKIN